MNEYWCNRICAWFYDYCLIDGAKSNSELITRAQKILSNLVLEIDKSLAAIIHNLKAILHAFS